jgi:hypothetical protein
LVMSVMKPRRKEAQPPFATHLISIAIGLGRRAPSSLFDPR